MTAKQARQKIKDLKKEGRNVITVDWMETKNGYFRRCGFTFDINQKYITLKDIFQNSEKKYSFNVFGFKSQTK